MTLSDLASAGSFVSGFAVLISLIYLSLQVRQAEKNQKASIRQGRAEQNIQSNLSLMDSSAAEAFFKGASGAEDISVAQLYQFRSWCNAMFSSAENNFYQHTNGLMDEAAFTSFELSAKSMFALPSMRAAWKLRRGSYQADFSDFLDKLLADVPVISTSGDPLVEWKKSIANEKAVTV